MLILQSKNQTLSFVPIFGKILEKIEFEKIHHASIAKTNACLLVDRKFALLPKTNFCIKNIADILCHLNKD